MNAVGIIDRYGRPSDSREDDIIVVDVFRVADACFLMNVILFRRVINVTTIG